MMKLDDAQWPGPPLHIVPLKRLLTPAYLKQVLGLRSRGNISVCVVGISGFAFLPKVTLGNPVQSPPSAPDVLDQPPAAPSLPHFHQNSPSQGPLRSGGLARELFLR